ncbi:MAG: deoxyhypusine synthase [Nanopusillaceae archaeon]
MEKVKDIIINGDMKIKELIDSLSNVGGFQAQELYRGYQILDEMLNKKEIIKVISFPADIIATGIRGIIKEVIKKRLFDIVITTCGTLDHDIARLEKDYFLGFFETDDIYLKERNIMRLGNIFIPVENYGPAIENFLKDRLRIIHKKLIDEKKDRIGTYEFIWYLGETLENHPKKDESIIYWSYKNKIPIIIPGISDGAVGTQILFYRYENPNFNIDIWEDEKFLTKIFFGNKKIGALILGGGISKHHVIWWAQFSEGLEYAVYISSAIEQDGSLSGAKTKEAITWGKIKKSAKHVNIWGDVTIIFPIIMAPFL